MQVFLFPTEEVSADWLLPLQEHNGGSHAFEIALQAAVHGGVCKYFKQLCRQWQKCIVAVHCFEGSFA
jgi:hypothetical protein